MHGARSDTAAIAGKRACDYYELRPTIGVPVYSPWCVQEQSNRKEVYDLKGELRSSKALVAGLQNTLQQRDLELDTVRSKVSPMIQHDSKN